MTDPNIKNIINKSDNILYSRIILDSKEIFSNLEEKILNKLKNENEGKCNSYGYIVILIDNIIAKTEGKMIETDFSEECILIYGIQAQHQILKLVILFMVVK